MASATLRLLSVAAFKRISATSGGGIALLQTSIPNGRHLDMGQVLVEARLDEVLGEGQTDFSDAQAIERCDNTLRGLSSEPQGKYGDASRGIMRVAMADFPTTGSSFIRSLLQGVAHSVGLGSPNGDIYATHEQTVTSFEKVYTHPDWNSSMGSTVFKTHFPGNEYMNVIEDKSPKSLAKIPDRHNASMHFDKLLVMLRHPHATVRSNTDRWEGKCYQDSKCIANGLTCWANWWQSVISKVGQDSNIFYLRYEDLCLHTAQKLKEVFNFIGGAYTSVTPDDIDKFFLDHPNKLCRYTKHDLRTQSRQMALDGWNKSSRVLHEMFETSELFSRFYHDNEHY